MESEEEKRATSSARLKKGRWVQWQDGVKGRCDNVTTTPRAMSEECWGRGYVPVPGGKKKGSEQTVKDGMDASPILLASKHTEVDNEHPVSAGTQKQ